jgi:hypothetical protein
VGVLTGKKLCWEGSRGFCALRGEMRMPVSLSGQGISANRGAGGEDSSVP